jgi:hypothetical protein
LLDTVALVFVVVVVLTGVVLVAAFTLFVCVFVGDDTSNLNGALPYVDVFTGDCGSNGIFNRRDSVIFIS